MHPLNLPDLVKNHPIYDKVNATLAGWHPPVHFDITLGALLSLWLGAVGIIPLIKTFQIALLMASIHCELPILVAPHVILQFVTLVFSLV